MNKIGLFYGPKGGSTEKVAKKIAEKLGKENVDIFSIKETDEAKVLSYSNIIFGIASVGRDTWDSNYPGTGWDVFLPNVPKLDFTGKTIALFGLGNIIIYPDQFCDAMGDLGKKLQKSGAELIGYTSLDGYDCNASEALVDGKFCGLPLDEDNEDHLTEGRLNPWIAEITLKFK